MIFINPGSGGPDELEAIFAFDFGERCVDRSREARIVKLDREIVAALLGGLPPGRASSTLPA